MLSLSLPFSKVRRGLHNSLLLMSLQAFLPLPGATFVARDRNANYFNSFLRSLNLFELSRELDQSLSPITSLGDLQQKVDLILQGLETAFEKASECCSHWTIGGLFGATPIGCYLEQLLHKKPLERSFKKTRKRDSKSDFERFGRSFSTEIFVSVSLNCIGLMHSCTPALALFGLLSSSFVETVIQHLIDLIALRSFVIFTQLIRERLAEYAEFKTFVPEYRVYQNFFQEHNYPLGSAWQQHESADASRIFKLIYTFDRLEDRRALLRKLLKVLKTDEVFQARLQKKLSKLGFVFLKALEVL
jgi:hypothetical protein